MELLLDRLTKQYGSKIAVDCVSATLKPGVYGLLGANGAGKTTLMRMVCDVLKPTSGRILYNGKEIEQLGEHYRSYLGYLPQDFGYYPDFTAKEYLEFISEQLSELDDITYRPMMGEYIIYNHGKVVGGIYDDRFLVKSTPSTIKMMPNAQMELPYEGAKKMILVDEVENKTFLKKLLEGIYEDFKKERFGD